MLVQDPNHHGPVAQHHNRLVSRGLGKEGASALFEVQYSFLSMDAEGMSPGAA
jgi:hypothetical protein